MDIFHSLMNGFSIFFTPNNLWMAIVGCFFGTLVGILPGLGSSATIALLIPFTFGMDATAAMVLITAIYYGSKYGGSTTSILINVPGESASVVTTFDGYQMARQGRAGAALGISAIGSFIGGILGTIGLILAAVPLAHISLMFGPTEYFSLIVTGMLTIVFLGGKSITKSLMSGVLGLSMGVVGLDIVQGAPRFVYGIPELMDGIDFVVMVMGIFGIGEVLVSAEKFMQLESIKVPFSKLWPTMKDMKDSMWPMIRGTVLGFFIGVLPGTGSTIASFLSYGLEKGVSKHPEHFGKGAIEGVAGPETANNAACSGAMAPLLTLGIPGSGATAIMLGALMLYGLKPGPMLFHTNPDFIWALFASMFVGNVILLIMNLPLVPLFALSLRISYSILYPIIILICMIGTYSLKSNVFDVWMMLMFGVAGYFMKKYDIAGAPMIIGLVLGPIMEQNLYRALALGQGKLSVFVTRPISAVLLGIALLLAIVVSFKTAKRMRTQIDDDKED
jgi:putative tricarboxylic transport membrane protein